MESNVEPAPVPLSGMRIGEPGAFATSSSAALRLPAAAGVKVTTRVQLCAGESDAPEHLREMLKSPGFMPVRMMSPIVSGAAPVFATVMGCAALTTLGATVPKLRAVGLSVSFGMLPANAARL